MRAVAVEDGWDNSAQYKWEDFVELPDALRGRWQVTVWYTREHMAAEKPVGVPYHRPSCETWGQVIMLQVSDTNVELTIAGKRHRVLIPFRECEGMLLVRDGMWSADAKERWDAVFGLEAQWP